MANLLRNLRQVLLGDEPPNGVRVVSTRTITLAPDQRLQPIRRSQHTVRLTPQPYWQEMGWQRNEDGYIGHFRTFGRTFPGRIVRAYGDTWDFFVHIPEPWPELRAHHKWGCYQLQGEDGWRKLHWNTRPTSIDAGIQDIENVLAQATPGRGR